MKVVFDESGNTGCVIANKNRLNFSTQPNFAICGIVLPTEKDERLLILKYRQFQIRHNLQGEIKGSDLMKKENNQLLVDFIENVLDRSHFKFNIYSKKFYLASLLCMGIMGQEFMSQFPAEFYNEVSTLALEDDVFFMEYCNFSKTVNVDGLRTFLKYITEYKYTRFQQSKMALIVFSQKILDEELEERFLNDFMTFGWYDNKKLSNVVNLNALGELFIIVKEEFPALKNDNIILIHDKTPEFECTISAELAQNGVSISFEDSKENIFIQIADNAVSVINKVYGLMINIFSNRAEWKPESLWIMEVASLLFRKLDNNIKFTVPIPNWAATLCIRDMYAPDFPNYLRNNINFNPRYENYQEMIFSDLLSKASEKSIFEDKLGELRR